MAIDLQEQEQLDQLKDWWKRNGNVLTWVLIAALLGYCAWAGWHYYQTKQSQQAAVLFEELQKAASAKDLPKVLRASNDIQEKFARTSYAEMAGLIAAKAHFDATDLEKAKAQLQWVSANGQDEDYKQVAKLRLSAILLDQKLYDEALKTLSGDAAEGFASLVADRKGDIFVAQNKVADAKAAYEEALKKITEKLGEKASEQSQLKTIIQFKLDNIGSATSIAATPIAASATPVVAPAAATPTVKNNPHVSNTTKQQ